MSSESFVAYYGLKFDISPEEFNLIEKKLDQRIHAARNHRLKSYWGNFSDGVDKYILLIGFQFGVFGFEGDSEAEFDEKAMIQIVADTEERIRSAGLEGKPALHLLWEPDL